MTTAEDILNKSKSKKQKKFSPIKRRAWDYLDNNDNNEKESNFKEIDQPQQNKKDFYLEKTIFEEETKSNVENHVIIEIPEGTDISIKGAVYRKLITLTGHQKEIMRLVTSHIKSSGGSYTFMIFPHILAIKIKSNVEVTRVSLKRLIKKNLLTRIKGERGRNGFCKFRVREDIVKLCFTLFNDVPSDINTLENVTEANH